MNSRSLLMRLYSSGKRMAYFSAVAYAEELRKKYRIARVAVKSLDVNEIGLIQHGIIDIQSYLGDIQHEHTFI